MNEKKNTQAEAGATTYSSVIETCEPVQSFFCGFLFGFFLVFTLLAAYG